MIFAKPRCPQSTPLLSALCATIPLGMTTGLPAQEGEGARDVLGGLRAGHPRLVLTDERLAELSGLRASDELLAKAVADALRQAEQGLELVPLAYEKRGPRLLHVSRACLERVYTLGLAWRLTGEERYAARVRADLLAVCAFPDWNPSHFLDTAEMSHAVGIGYDWCHSFLDEDARATIRAALVAKGLDPGLRCYGAERPAWWTQSPFNWNQVCNGGLLIGALAVAESEPERARAILAAALQSLPTALETYEPDGAWPEGPGYWGYATAYTVFGLAALETALGHDFGLSERRGLARAGFFPLSACGPTGLYAAYADVGERARRRGLPVLFWLARRYDEPALAAAEREWIGRERADPLHVIWYAAAPARAAAEPPLDELYRGPVPIALLRGAEGGERALFLALKAGYNAVNHGHLDLGSFELDALGARWARDLGSDDYDLPGYWDGAQGGRRWSYYRLGSASHNLCLPAGAQQAVAARATVRAFESRPQAAHVIVDLAGAYPGLAERVARGAALVGGRRAVLIQDELELLEECELVWGMTTDATIRLDGERATLAIGDEELRARVLAPAGVAFTVESAGREPPEKRNAGVSRLVLRFPAARGPLRVAVLLAPRWAPDEPALDPPLRPLAEWY